MIVQLWLKAYFIKQAKLSVPENILIGTGIESGSPRMLKYINKNITLDEIDKVDTLFSKFQIYKHWNFMTAFPGETIEDIKLTIKLIIKLAYTSFDSPYPFSSYNRFIPLPGTKLFNVAKAIWHESPRKPRRMDFIFPKI